MVLLYEHLGSRMYYLHVSHVSSIYCWPTKRRRRKSWKCHLNFWERKKNECFANIFIMCLDFFAKWTMIMISSFTLNVILQRGHAATWTWRCYKVWVIFQVLCSSTCLRITVSNIYIVVDWYNKKKIVDWSFSKYPC